MHSFFKSKGCTLPLIQAGMIWTSGAKLAATCANNHIIGTLGAGSMSPDVLKLHLDKLKNLVTDPEAMNRVAINLPLLYKNIEAQIESALDAGIKIFITSAGSPKTFTKKLKDHGVEVIHVISNPELAKKCEDAGVDMVIAEGFEAGGHNGRDEITTLVLIPQVCAAVKIPVIAAGGIASARAMRAVEILGASGSQMGTRFLMTTESSVHDNYKNLLLQAGPGDTKLMMKKHIPVRLFKNKFFQQVLSLEEQGASTEDLIQLLGKGRAKLGMFDGNLDEGELEIGQIVSAIKNLPSAQQLIASLKQEYHRDF